MRILIGQIVIFSLLFGSIEGTTDTLLHGQPHGDEAAHQAEFGHPLDEHDGNVPDSDLDGDHCDHCCHGHCSTIVCPVGSCIAPVSADDRRIANQPHLQSFARAPPTPPPNA